MRGGPRLYIGNLHHRTDRRYLEDIFRDFGRVNRVDVKNGYGFIEFEDERDAADARADMDGRDIDGSRVTVEWAKGTPRGRDNPRRGGRPPPRDGNRIILEDIPNRMSWQDLKDEMRKFGDVMYADVFTERGMKGGVVEFRHREDMHAAIDELDDRDFHGHRVRVFPESGGGGGGRRSRDRSPRGRRSRDSLRRNSRDRRSPSPRRRRSPSGSRDRRGRSPSGSRDRRGRSPSGSRSRSKSPRGRSGSRGRSPSPRRDRSPSPRRDRSPSPRRDRSPSPRRDRSPSPSPRRSPSRSRSPSR